ncbi:hypothetical protein [Bacillus thuringiensis]|uniref:hypothetical protein n=1 Tax=Bacillus thuringiensis TaxID=1428 RepID=UPI000BFC34C5|nr:hypothetical protein [Bacillus thuringiensis]PGT89875.1 hypothetical protein COD17_08990 [Bacillus thuringiensis]
MRQYVIDGQGMGKVGTNVKVLEEFQMTPLEGTFSDFVDKAVKEIKSHDYMLLPVVKKTENSVEVSCFAKNPMGRKMSYRFKARVVTEKELEQLLQGNEDTSEDTTKVDHVLIRSDNNDKEFTLEYVSKHITERKYDGKFRGLSRKELSEFVEFENAM